MLGLGRRTEEVLVLVKAYPNPSSRYGESACIAGVTRDNEWIRLYPVDFRHLPADRRLRKWQWIRVRVTKSRRDPRRESHSPDQASIQPLERIEDWARRRAVIDRLTSPSLETLRASGASLGVIRPAVVSTFEWEVSRRVWNSGQLDHLRSAGRTLFSEQRKVPVLERIPYAFFYAFSCDGVCNHRLSIVDWEVMESYRKWRADRHSLPEDKLRLKYQDQLTQERDLHLLLGAPLQQHRFGSFLVVGVFYPPRGGTQMVRFDR